MGLFGKKKISRIVGVDFGTSAIKAVELSFKDGKPYLENYGWFDLAGIGQDADPSQPKAISYEEKMRMALVSLLRKMDVQSEYVNVSIPGSSGLVVLVEFPVMEGAEMEKAIEFEAHKYIPTSIEEVFISWEVMKNAGNEKPKDVTEVLLVAAPKREVRRLGGYLEGSDLKVDTMELETFSIARSVYGKEKGVALIIDIGSKVTNLILVENGSVTVNGTVDVGGNDLTIALSESLNISMQRAETFKKEGKDIINDKETAIMMPALQLLIMESKRIIASYKEKKEKAEVSKAIISGGSAEFFGIEKYFSNALGINVVKGNPLDSIYYSKEVAPFIEKIGSSLSVAIGLALRGNEDDSLKGK